MEAPELFVIPASPLASPSLSRRFRTPHEATPITSVSASSLSQSSGSIRSSSEDTAVTIFSLYTGGREDLMGSTKVLALNDIEPVVMSHSRRQAVESHAPETLCEMPSNQGKCGLVPTQNNSHSFNAQRRDGQSLTSTVGNGHAMETTLFYQHSTASSSVPSASPRGSEESTHLPYARQPLPSPERLLPAGPLPPPTSPYPSPSPQIHSFFPDFKVTEAPRGLLAEQSASTPDHSQSSQPSEGEDPDSFHIRSTYAQLETSGVRGDGYEEGVELTRAKQGGTTYLTSQPHDRGRGPGGDLNLKELAVLASVDRYGFFTTPSPPSDRLLLLPTAALSKSLSPISSSASPSPFPPTPPPLLTLPPIELVGFARDREYRRTSKWNRMLEPDSNNRSGNVLAWRIVSQKEHKLRQRVYKGVPDIWRAVAWAILVERFAGPIHTSQESLAEQYRDTLDKPSSHDIQIDLDVPRTISGHIMFRTRYGLGQRALFHVLHAFSLHCAECGYVQGMGPIAASLLCYYEPEKVYALLVRLHGAYAMHTVFSPGFPGLLESIYVQERIMQHMLPSVYASFKKHNVSSTSYTTKWYITLFANTVPFQTQLRLWDVFFLEGRDMIVIIAIAILWVFKDQLTAASATFETILSLLSSFFVPESDDAFMKWIERALGDRKLRDDMQSWRNEWKDLVAQGREHTILL